MKIACVSDTHNTSLPLRSYPEADILIHAGDATFKGRVQDITFFTEMLSKHLCKNKYHSGYKEIIFVPGNHDWLFEKDEYLARRILSDYGIKTLINESIEINGLKIWGSPVTSPFYNWAFNWEEEKRRELWESIPNDSDVVITHGPPYGILDKVVYKDGSEKLTGCELLEERIFKVRPKAHIFGHIHQGYGQTEICGIKFVNASFLNGEYRGENPVQVIEV